MMDNFWVGVQLFLIIALILYFFFTLYSYLRPSKNTQLAGVVSEPWLYKEKELTLIFKKDARPNQNKIDDIKNNIDQYLLMVFDFIKESEEFRKYSKDEIILEGISFPVLDTELNNFDFSIDFQYAKEDDSFLVAYLKDGKVLRLVVNK